MAASARLADPLVQQASMPAPTVTSILMLLGLKGSIRQIGSMN
jgi:hypothetical protein